MGKNRNYLVFYVVDKDCSTAINDRIRVITTDGTVLVKFAEDDKVGISCACSGTSVADALVRCRTYDRELRLKSILLDVIPVDEF